MDPFKRKFYNRMEPYYVKSIENGIKLLLETKHLYQNLEIELPDIKISRDEWKKLIEKTPKIVGQKDPVIEDPITVMGISPAEILWSVQNPHSRRPSFYLGDNEETDVWVSIDFLPPTTKLFCRKCKRIEAFNFQYGSDLLKEYKDDTQHFLEQEDKQVFSLAYQCQSCKSLPEIFLVQRDGLKINQSGRAPMEKFETPSSLPKDYEKYFSGAVIAFNSGQTLASNFLLRTFIEQFVRSQSSIPDSQSIDILFDEYNKKLPDDFKQRFPSLKSVYEELSNDLHLATASKDVFNNAKDDIVKHFQARVLYDELNTK
ncbi:MAG TPA: hypothetical protein VJ987_10915 [Anaerolineales bacterium]|nr:hypothetical protein [Anaerolineales bacterium]